MKTIKDKQVLVAADFAGVALKNAVVAHLEKNGWTCTDIGVKEVDEKNPEMFHRIGLRVGAKIAEGEFERAMLFCGTGMGIHIAASKCPHVHAAVVESVPAALRCITGNNCNVISMGGAYVAPAMGIEIAEAFLYLAYDELDSFDYETFKKNGFTFPGAIDIPLEDCPKPEELKSR